MKRLDARTCANKLAWIAWAKALLLPVLFVSVGCLAAPGSATAQSTAEVCRETKKVLAQYRREYEEVARLADVKAAEDEWRGVLSEVRRGIASGFVIPRLNLLAYRLKLAPPGSSHTERLAFQRTFRDLLEKAIQQTRDSSLDELDARANQIFYQQTEPRRARMSALHCNEVLAREGEANLSGT